MAWAGEKGGCPSYPQQGWRWKGRVASIDKVLQDVDLPRARHKGRRSSFKLVGRVGGFGRRQEYIGDLERRRDGRSSSSHGIKANVSGNALEVEL